MTLALQRSDVERFRVIVSRHFGLEYEDGKLDHLADVLRQRMEVSGCPGVDSYLERVTASLKRPEELRALAAQLTVNETFFFRNADNFRAFAEAVLPERVQKRGHDKHLRILSAGCASGEEPFSLAIALRETLPDLASWDVKIVAVDVNPVVLAKAERARYTAWSLRATPEDTKNRYFGAEAKDYVLHPEIQRMVTFEERNLVEENTSLFRPLSYDVVFCRNVLMYFAPDKARDVVERISRALMPGGFFFLGHAETLRGLTHDFHLCHTHDTFYYRRREPTDEALVTTVRHTPPGGVAAGPLPLAIDSTASWVDVIQRASERILALSNGRGRARDEEVPHTSPVISGVPRALARTWDLGLVLEAMRQERFSDALALICALPADSHEDADALLLRAVLLTNNGRLDESEEVCRRLLALDELNAGAHYLMALCREHAGDGPMAVEHGQTAVYLDPGFAMPHVHLGIMAKRAGDLPTARRELGQALILLTREEAFRVLLFGGGFSRETLLELCRSELRMAGGEG